MIEEAKPTIVQTIIKWFSYLVALSFIVMGAGILSGRLLGGRSTISANQRLIFGGVILVYGIVRIVMIYRRSSRLKKELQLQGKNGSYNKKSLTM